MSSASSFHSRSPWLSGNRENHLKFGNPIDELGSSDCFLSPCMKWQMESSIHEQFISSLDQMCIFVSSRWPQSDLLAGLVFSSSDHQRSTRISLPIWNSFISILCIHLSLMSTSNKSRQRDDRTDEIDETFFQTRLSSRTGSAFCDEQRWLTDQWILPKSSSLIVECERKVDIILAPLFPAQSPMHRHRSAERSNIEQRSVLGVVIYICNHLKQRTKQRISFVLWKTKINDSFSFEKQRQRISKFICHLKTKINWLIYLCFSKLNKSFIFVFKEQMKSFALSFVLKDYKWKWPFQMPR